MQEKSGIVGIDAGKRHMEVIRLYREKEEIQRGISQQANLEGADLKNG